MVQRSRAIVLKDDRSEQFEAMCLSVEILLWQYRQNSLILHQERKSNTYLRIQFLKIRNSYLVILHQILMLQHR